MVPPHDYPGQLSRRRFLTMAAALGAASGLARWESAHARSLGVTRVVLSNGLTVIAEERPSADTVALWLGARVGTREDGARPGLQILTALMLFRGTERWPNPPALMRGAAEVGGVLRRSTAAEWSSISTIVPSAETERGFELLGEIVGAPRFAADELPIASNLLLREISQRERTASLLADDLVRTGVLADHPVGGPALGTAEALATLRYPALVANRTRYWGASNLVLGIVGRLRTDTAFELANRHLGDLPRGEANARAPVSVQPGREAQTVQAVAGRQQAQLRLGCAAPSLYDADRAAAMVVRTLTSGGIRVELRSEQGLAYRAGSSYLAFTDAGAWYATTGVDPTTVDAGLAGLYAELQRTRARPPTPNETARYAEQTIGRLLLAEEANAVRARLLAEETLLGLTPRDELIEQLRRVRADDLDRVIQTYLDPARALVVLVRPELD